MTSDKIIYKSIRLGAAPKAWGFRERNLTKFCLKSWQNNFYSILYCNGVARQLVVTIWSQPFDRRQFGRIITLIVNWRFEGFEGYLRLWGWRAKPPIVENGGYGVRSPPHVDFYLRPNYLRSNALRPNCCDQIVTTNCRRPLQWRRQNFD